MAKYRAAVIGIGWMGMLNDIGTRWTDPGPYGDRGQWHVDDVDRPMPKVDVHRKFYFYEDRPPVTFAETLADRPEVDLIAGAERDKQRLQVFGDRYGVKALYTDAAEMLRNERPEIVAIPSNTKDRPKLTVLAVENGAKGIMTEKPIAYTLEEADRMVKACADAGVPLVCGAISTNHPSFGKAKELVTSGAIGDVISIEAESDNNLSQHQNWSYFVDSAPAWVIGIGDTPPGPEGSEEFRGQGMMVTVDGQVVFFRKGAPAVRITGTSGEIEHQNQSSDWRLWQEIETPAGLKRVEVPWPAPQQSRGLSVSHGFNDIFECLDGKLDEPKNSGRRVAVALEVEIAIKLSSARGGARVDLPLEDRSLELVYDWHR
jgi:hypothetical protein